MMARAGGALLVLGGGLAMLSRSVDLDLRMGAPIAVAATGVAAIGFGVLFLLLAERIPARALFPVPALVTALVCVPMYLLEPTSDGAEPLLVCGVVFGGFVLPRGLALVNVAVAVAAYAPASIVVDSAVGLTRTLYLATASLVALLIIAPTRERLADLFSQAQGRERSDELTGLLTPRAFEELVNHELARCQRSGLPLALLSVDLDSFQRVNDQNGIAAGDRALRNTAEVLRTQMRDSDVLARTGGAAFGILLPGCGLDDAVRRAEHIRSLIERTAETWPTPFTASIGVATAPSGAATVLDLAAAAAKALLLAKEGGRNRVAVGSGASSTPSEPAVPRGSSEAPRDVTEPSSVRLP